MPRQTLDGKLKEILAWWLKSEEVNSDEKCIAQIKQAFAEEGYKSDGFSHQQAIHACHYSTHGIDDIVDDFLGSGGDPKKWSCEVCKWFAGVGTLESGELRKRPSERMTGSEWEEKALKEGWRRPDAK